MPMKVLNAALLVVLSGLIFWMNPAMSSEPVVRMYFIVPFGTETYVGIDEDNIEEYGRSVLFMYERPFIHELINMLESRPISAPHLNWIRVKMVLVKTGEVYLIDRDGLVRKKSNKALFRLIPEQVKQIEDQLARLVGVVDLEAFQDLTRQRKTK